jgi:heat shock protein HtpX
MSFLAPIGAMIIQMAISRSREYQADATGARLAGSSDGLADALGKLGSYTRQLPMNANPSTAHMFIVNPLSGRGLQSLFSTHPPLEERIARLRSGRPAAGFSDGPSPPETPKAPKPPRPPRSTPGGGSDRGRDIWDQLK